MYSVFDDVPWILFGSSEDNNKSEVYYFETPLNQERLNISE